MKNREEPYLTSGSCPVKEKREKKALRELIRFECKVNLKLK